jgi:NTP pyrophosphatase (non-canonical NTP hydrolase)
MSFASAALLGCDEDRVEMMLNDDLVADLLAFRKERDWEQFHSARNLAAALSVEAAELLEHFIWAGDADVASVAAAKRDRIAAEIADVAIYLSYLAHDLGIDIDAAVHAKLRTNAERYPVAKARGSSTKYSDL